jgi:hypothetical protein
MKNLDQYLLNFLSDSGDLFIDNLYGEFQLFRFYLIGKDIYVVTREPDIKCSIGTFELYDKMTYKLHYDFDVYCLAYNKSSKIDRINVINRRYKPEFVKKKLLEFMNNRGI